MSRKLKKFSKRNSIISIFATTNKSSEGSGGVKLERIKSIGEHSRVDDSLALDEHSSNSETVSEHGVDKINRKINNTKTVSVNEKKDIKKKTKLDRTQPIEEPIYHEIQQVLEEPEEEQAYLEEEAENEGFEEEEEVPRFDYTPQRYHADTSSETSEPKVMLFPQILGESDRHRDAALKSQKQPIVSPTSQVSSTANERVSPHIPTHDIEYPLNGTSMLTEKVSEIKRNNENKQKSRLEHKYKPMQEELKRHKGTINNSQNNEVIRRRTILQHIKNIEVEKAALQHKHGSKKKSNQYGNEIDAIDIAINQFDSGDQSSENEKDPHSSKKRPPKIAIGLSIIYGITLFALGIFLSLDTLAGKLGKYRTFTTVFYSIVFSVGISWIIYLFIDINNYKNKLNKFKEEQNVNQEFGDNLKWKKDPENAYGNHRRTSALRAAKIYDTPDDFRNAAKKKDTENAYGSYGHGRAAAIMNNIYDSPSDFKNQTNNATNNVDYTEKMNTLVNFDGEHFSGYVIDSSQPYNMYLRTGIGIFCMITLLQCSIDVVEMFENYSVGITECASEMHDAILAIFQILFFGTQFLFIFAKGNIVICKNNVISYLFTMHLAVINFIVWARNILIETQHEYYGHTLHEIFHGERSGPPIQSTASAVVQKTISDQVFDMLLTARELLDNADRTPHVSDVWQQRAAASASSLLTPAGNETTLIDCYENMILKTFFATLKSYLYPVTIEFSISCATIFMIMWFKIDTFQHHYMLMPTKKKIQDTKFNMPHVNMYIVLDCTKTSKGLFLGLIIFVGTVLSTILFKVFNASDDTKETAKLLSEITEILLLVMALGITCYVFYKVRRHYQKITPEVNIFDIALEIISLGGLYAYSINSLIAIFYNFDQNGDESNTSETNITASITAILSIIQGTLQTLLILECLRRYAAADEPFMRKPAREFITTLLMINVSLWLFETLSAKKFDTKPFLVAHFGILKWSIINAFSSPIAIFYRFHSSVCLSDIWYGLYYGEEEHEHHKEPKEHEFDEVVSV